MNLKRRTLTGMVAASALAIGAFVAAAPASAVTVEGGTWNYGPGYSDYLHPSKLHRSSACNGNGVCNRSGDFGGGKWAKAKVGKTPSGNTAYYYNY